LARADLELVPEVAPENAILVTPEDPAKSSRRMLKSSRLLKHADFQSVYKNGKKRFSGNVTLFFRDRDDTSGPRVGFTVGKVLGEAVVRNRIRRRMRAVVRERLPLLTRPLDVVLHPRKSVLTLEFARLDAEIQQLFAAIQRGERK
jgi:ribonuclease P protein component